MTDFLVVQLAAPLAAFGNAPGNVERKTLDRPTRSALIGLAGAALGVERQDADANERLASSFSTASRTLCAGQLLRDFHTYESIQRSKEVYRTRADALARGTRNVSITRRDYRSGGWWLGAYAQRHGACVTLEMLAEAFRAPAFTLYLGRKSCSLSRPLVPKIVAEADIVLAFARYAQFENLPVKGLIAVDEDLLPAGRSDFLRRNMVRDDPRSRSTWQFGMRAELLLGADEEEIPV